MLTPAVRKHIAEVTRAQEGLKCLLAIETNLHRIHEQMEPGHTRIEFGELLDELNHVLETMFSEGCLRCGNLTVEGGVCTDCAAEISREALGLQEVSH